MSSFLNYKSVVLLPKIVYATPGIEVNIYFANIWQSVSPQNYAYVVKCAVGRQWSKRWSWTPSNDDAGKNFGFTIEIYDDHSLCATQSCIIKTSKQIPPNNRKITLALLGDSLVNCQYPEACRKLMIQNGFPNYTPVGSHLQPTLNSETSIAHDGLGGFSWHSFLNRWTYSKRELSLVQEEAEIAQMKEFGIEEALYGEHLLKSPLLRLINGRTVLDIPHWFCKINNGQAPDYLVIELGINDCFDCMKYSDCSIFQKKILPDASFLLDQIRIYAPNTIIGVSIPPFGGTQDGFGENYGCDYSCYIYRKYQLIYDIAIAEMVNKRNDSRMSILPLYHNIDPESGYIFKEVPRNSHSAQMMKQCVNGVHPSKEGGLQIADSIYCWLINHFV